MSSSVWLQAAVLALVACGPGRSPTTTEPELAQEPLRKVTPTPARTPCPVPPPKIHSPRDGAVVSGVIRITYDFQEVGCAITASTAITILGPNGPVIHTLCDHDFSTQWTTTNVPNGTYEIRAQHSCGCSPVCTDFESIRVTVSNR